MMLSNDMRQTFTYDPISGAIDRIDKSRMRRKHTGTKNMRKDTAYVVLCVDGKKVYGHRVAWMIANGDIPDGMVIDHINGDGIDNRICNLRLVSKSVNQRNRRVIRAGGLNGVHSHKNGFQVVIGGDYAGWTKDFFDACCIRKSLELKRGYVTGEVK